MLLGDADIEVAIGVFAGETQQPGPFAHGRGNADEARIGPGHVAQPVAENLGIGQLARTRGGLDSFFRREFGNTVVKNRVGLGQPVALAFLGDDVKELRPFQLAQVFQRRDQHIEVMAIDRAVVVKSEFLEKRAGRDHALDVLLGAPDQFEQWRR